MERTVKERACLYALRHGAALYVHGRDVYAIYADGTRVVVCHWQRLDEIWSRALAALERHADLLPPSAPKYRVETPTGVFEAETVVQLLVRWVLRRHTLYGIIEEQG